MKLYIFHIRHVLPDRRCISRMLFRTLLRKMQGFADCLNNSKTHTRDSKKNKIRDLFKVKLYAIRSETKRERERESETLNIH